MKKTGIVYKATYVNMGQTLIRSFKDRKNAELWLKSFCDNSISEDGQRVKAFKEIKEI